MIGFINSYTLETIPPDELKDFLTVSLTYGELSLTVERLFYDSVPLQLRPCTLRDVKENFYFSER